jgi:O-antigen/teichoic acid export membrane protein
MGQRHRLVNPLAKDQADGTINPRGASGIGAASMVAAVSGLVVLFISARALSIEDNSQFLVFWGALFGVYGILGGVQAESTRAVRAAALNQASISTPGAGVLRSGVTVGFITAGAIVVLGLLFGQFVFGADSAIIVLSLAVAAVVYSGHAALAGSIQGMRHWRSYAGLITGEALVRLTAIAVATVIGASLLGLEVASLAAVLVWLGWLLVSKSARSAAKARADVPMNVLLRQTGHALISAGSSAALIVSYPLLVRITATSDQYETAAPLLLAISLTRAPIMLPMQAFQGVAIAHLVKSGNEGAAALRKPVFIIMALALLGALTAGSIGPSIMTIFGPGYRVDGLILACLTLSAGLISILTLLGTAVLAVGKHRSYSLGWLSSTIVAVALLLLPVGLELKCVLSLSLGPLTGISVFILTLRRR